MIRTNIQLRTNFPRTVLQEIWAAFAHQMVLKEVRSRAGILGFTRQIAVDYATRGIRVNAVSPGPVTTDLGRTSVENEPDFPPLGPAGSVRPLLDCRAFAP